MSLQPAESLDMTLVTLDVVLLLPHGLRGQAIAFSNDLADRMQTMGHPSGFRLGQSLSGDGAHICEPHVSLFMLSVQAKEIVGVIETVDRLSGRLMPLHAEGEEYGHNSQGAPEVYFKKSSAWTLLQAAVVAAVEPLRGGRLRDVDPNGHRLADIMADGGPADQSRVKQLERYGYDEVDERFAPHVTLAWPEDRAFRVALDGVPSASSFAGRLAQLAVYGMGPYGTCTVRHGVFPLGSG